MRKGISLEGSVYLFCAYILVIIFFASSSSYGADSYEKQLSFSNKDLKPYENSDAKPRELQSEPKNSEVRKTKAEDSREQKEKEYWCKKAAPQRRKIQQLHEEIKTKERELAEENAKFIAKNKKTGTFNKSLLQARKRLKDAEGRFGDLQDEAYRKGVPMGWLRCQFE